MIPVHWLHIYQQPAVGDRFIRSYPAYQYRHKISSSGGFDTMECAIGVTAVEAERIYEQYIGCRVAVFVDNPVVPIWEGLISRVTYTPGGLSLTRSTDEMYNRLNVRSSHNLNGPLSEQEAGEANNTDSQIAHGIKMGTFDGGSIWNGTVQTAYMQALRDSILNHQAWPQVSMNFSGNNSVAGFISLECIGFYHTLQWEETTTQNNSNAGIAINAVLAALVNGTTFFDNSDTTDVSTNTTFNYRPREASAQSAWDLFKTLTEAGDSSGNLWVCGITPTLPLTGTRRFYYRLANTDVAYTARVSDNLRIRNPYGGLERLWTIQPDRGIRINDILIGWNSVGDDPREMYIETVNYDADKQEIQLRGADDITWEGVFQFRQRNKAYNRRAGANRKQLQLS